MTTPAFSASHANDGTNPERTRLLRLQFECLQTLPVGSNPVRVWWDQNLECYRVGKRVDLSSVDGVLPEPATLQKIKHDNVVEVLAAPAVEGLIAPLRAIEIITPYYPRGSVTDAFLRGERFSATESVRIVQAGLRGLGHLHEVHRILHRDIKSPNLLLDDIHMAKVADLGCAGALAADGTVEALDIPTLYSPPELVRTGVLTRASDIYPMGLILLELLRGGFDYEAYPKSVVTDRLLRGMSPLTLEERRRPIWLSRSLRRVLNQALQGQPARRFPTASAMDNALSRARVIDWAETDDHCWEAPYRHHRDRRIRIEAASRRKGGFRLSMHVDRGSGWRRHGVTDVDVDALDSTVTRRFFDQATDIAIVR